MIVCRVPGRVGAVWRVTSVTPWRCDVSWRLRFRPQLYNCDICYQQTTALLPCPTLSSPWIEFLNFCHWYSLTLERPSLIGHLSKCPCWNWDSCSLNIHRLFCGHVDKFPNFGGNKLQLQLGQASLNPPRLVLEVGGLQLCSHAWEAELPHLGTLTLPRCLAMGW